MLIGVIAEEILLPFVVAPPRWVDGGPLAQAFSQPDIIYFPRSTIIGFVMPGLVDETDVIGGAENVFHTYVTDGYQGIWPDLFDDTVPEIFYAFSHSFVPVLTPVLWSDPDRFYGAIIPVIPPLAPIGRFVDTDIFYSPAFQAGVFPALIANDDVIRATIVRRDGDAFVLLTETFDDADTFYTASLARGLAPGLVTQYYPDNDLIYPASNAAFVAPAAFSAADIFFTAFVYNQLQPSRVIDADTFIGPELRTPGRMALLVDDDIFPVPSVQFAPLLPPLVVEADAIPSVITGSVPPIVPFDAIVDFEDTFYVPNVIIFQALAPHLWPDIDTVLSVPSVALGQPLFPALFTDADIFFAPILTLVPVLAPNVFTDADTFLVPTILVDQSLQAGIITDSDTFFAPSMTALAGFDGTLALDGPIMPSDPPLTVIYIEH